MSRTRPNVMVVVLGAVAFAAAVVVLDPGSNPLLPACPSHTWLGVYCPGCGTIRAVHALLHGDVRTMLGMNPMLPAFLVYLTILGAAQVSAFAPLRRPLTGTIAARAWLGAFLVFWFLRNLPVEPFVWLAPG